MRRVYLLLASLAVVAAITTVFKVTLTAAATDVVSTYVEGDLPVDDVDSPLWEQATPVEVPLSAQNIAQPMNLDPSVKSVTLRSLNNGRWVSFLLEWEDDTKDLGGRIAEFKDSVAIQFPMEGGQPFVCMGVAQEGNGVDILHWRSDFQRDIEEGYPGIKDIYPNMGTQYYPEPELVTFQTAAAAGNVLADAARLTSVEDLHAGGFGTLAATEPFNAVGWGVWKDGRWKVVIARPLETTDPLDARLTAGGDTSLALAVWDGSKGEINGKKAVSSWVSLRLEAPEAAADTPAQERGEATTGEKPPASRPRARSKTAPREQAAGKGNGGKVVGMGDHLPRFIALSFDERRAG